MGLNFDFMRDTFILALSGIPVTLKITFISLLLAAPQAIIMALARIYKVKGLSQISTLFTSFIRGVPMILQILILYSFLPSMLNAAIEKAGLSINVFEINPIYYAYIVFASYASASLAEILRSSLLTVARGQMEAAYAIGLTTVQAYRRIVAPQALVAALPNICNLTISLIKGTSLAFLMTVKDITAIAKIEAAYGYNYIEAYIDIFIIYIVICYVIQKLFSILEKALSHYKNVNTKRKEALSNAYSN